MGQVDGGLCAVGGSLEQFNTQLRGGPLYSESLCGYKNKSSCPSSTSCVTDTTCARRHYQSDKKKKKKKKSKANLGGYVSKTTRQSGHGWDVKTIIFLILALLFAAPVVYQLFKRFRGTKMINYTILVASGFLSIISGLLFVLFLKHII
jgi:hypothetical protein